MVSGDLELKRELSTKAIGVYSLRSGFMSFNLDKSKVLTVHSTHKVLHGTDDTPVFSAYNRCACALKSVALEKDLGVDITPKFS